MIKTRLELGPFNQPVSSDIRRVVKRFIRQAEKKGYAVVETESSSILYVSAVKQQLEQVSAPELAGAEEGA